VQWIKDCSLLHEYLDAVAKNPFSFAVPLIARESIADALSPSAAYSTISDHSLSLFTWVEMGVTRKLHRDGIFVSLKDSHAIQFRNFETRQLENCLRANCSFGTPPVELHMPLWYLRPPSSTLLSGRFGFKGFTKAETVPPNVHEYLVVPLVATDPKDWRPIALQTVVEAQKLKDSQTVKSPRRELAHKQLESAQCRGHTTPPVSFVDGFVTPTCGNTLGTRGCPVTVDEDSDHTQQFHQKRSAPSSGLFDNQYHTPHLSDVPAAQQVSQQPFANLFTGFGATVSHSLDPLTQCLHAANSCNRTRQPNASMFSTPFQQGFPGGNQLAFGTAPPGSASALFPLHGYTVIQVVARLSWKERAPAD